MKVFFDASVLFSALYSKMGGSAKLVSLVKSGIVIGITTQSVIEELEENLTKLKQEDSTGIHNFIEENRFLARKTITFSEIEPYHSLVEDKDAHVIAGAILTKCEYLVTLDKKHLDNRKVKAKTRKIKILSPKELIRITLTI